eukprot:1745397-Pyramimonas_sp.AAC.3
MVCMPATPARASTHHVLPRTPSNRVTSTLRVNASGVAVARMFGAKAVSKLNRARGSGIHTRRSLVLKTTASVIDVEGGHFKIEREGYFFLDIR